ncbi:hypothetical protein JXB22_10270 [candidate division WOR-3 bacterium]|nr:hypothetical protein [candidate division WOR-3 bacterium]
MKKSPQQEKFEKMLDASKFSACGFMGNDKRTVWEIIDADTAMLEKLGTTREKIARRMREITDQGIRGLGDWVKVSDTLMAMVNDARGTIPCPWAHNVRCLKRITIVERTDIDKRVRWSELSIHLINDHGFFQGKGSPYRLEPETLAAILR